MSELSVQTVLVTLQETTDWGGIPMTISCGDQSVSLIVTDCISSSPLDHSSHSPAKQNSSRSSLLMW